MNTLLIAWLAAGVASVASAQTSPPKPTANERQSAVESVTQQGSGSSASTQKTAAEQAKNVKVSKETPKITKEEKSKLAKDATRLNVNPENSSGQAATSAMQKETVAASKATQKQNAAFKTKQGKAQLGKALQDKSTP
jgi:hypothetical protein